ncbi:response regulator transcription factor [Desulfallas sp. Bu1-1]|nr:response regulator transcription factor [Desulfallas sp. Bu1-1]
MFQPDAVLVDITGETPKYFEPISQLKHECPCSLIIALLENEHCEGITEMLAHGVDSCVPRGIMRGCLLKTVELACRAGIFCLPGSFKKLMSSAGTEKAIPAAQFKNGLLGGGESLTRREMEILQLMARNYSNREIASKLFISEPTVKTHVSSILRKLGQNNRAQAIIYSYKIGLVNEHLAVHS